MTKPEELSATQLIEKAEDDVIALPFFQRDYVWEAKDVTMFLDTMSKLWPAGSIILWDKPKAGGRKFGSLKSNPKDTKTNMLVLDGQQRITTLLLLKRYGQIELNEFYGKTTRYYFFFDLEKHSFIPSREENLEEGRYIDIEDILRRKVPIGLISKKYLQRKNQRLLLKNLRALPDYKFPIIHTDVGTDEAAIDIFNRVNTSGKRVDKLELAFARLRDKEHTVSKKITEFQSEWVGQGFDLTPRVLINSFLIVRHINDKYHLTTRNADNQIRDYLNNHPAVISDWGNVFKRITSALHFLNRIGFDSDQFLTSENTIAVLAGYFARSDIKSRELSTRRRNHLKSWLFRTLLTRRYTYTTNFEQDLKDLQDSGNLPIPSKGTPSDYTDDGLISVMYAIGRSNGMTDYDGNKITWADTRRRNRIIHIDHIYPYSRLTKKPISDIIEKEDLVDSVGNKAFAIGESNLSKNKYFLGRGACSKVKGQWMEGTSLLGEADYVSMCKSTHTLRKNWRIIRNFINDRQGKIIRSIKREI